CWPPSPSTSPAPLGSWPRGSTPRHAPPRSALSSSTSRPGSPTAPAPGCCTSPGTGPGSRPGTTSSTPPAARYPPRLDRQPLHRRDGTDSGKAGQTGRSPTPFVKTDPKPVLTAPLETLPKAARRIQVEWNETHREGSPVMAEKFDVEQRWPELFAQLDETQRHAVVQSLASAW